MDDQVLQIESAKLLKEWSIWLITIQAAILTALTSAKLIKPVDVSSFWSSWLVLFFAASILFATVLVGAIPTIVQEIDQPMRECKIFWLITVRGIYTYNQFGFIPIWLLASLEHIFFILGLGVQVKILL